VITTIQTVENFLDNNTLKIS